MKTITKICRKCMIEKELKEFYQTRTTKDKYTTHCRSCYQLYREEHRENQRSYMQRLRRINKDAINEKKRKSWRATRLSPKVIMGAKSRAKRKGIEFNIEDSDVVVPSICPLLNIPLIPGTQKDYEQTPSVDRIDPSKGYIKGNVWVISKRANTMKNNATKEELIIFALNVLKMYKTDEEVDTLWNFIKNNKE